VPAEEPASELQTWSPIVSGDSLVGAPTVGGNACRGVTSLSADVLGGGVGGLDSFGGGRWVNASPLVAKETCRVVDIFPSGCWPRHGGALRPEPQYLVGLDLSVLIYLY
jgi:hypothetical protein